MTTWKLIKEDAVRLRHLERQSAPNLRIIGVIRAAMTPRMIPVVLARLGRACYLMHIPSIGKIFSLVNFVIFGLEVAPQCEIAGGLILPHTQGTVLGAARIGANVTIFQGVTLGAKYVDYGFSPSLRPTIGDNVIVGSGAKIIGGINIGHGATVGANAVVVRDVPEHVTVVGIPARQV